MERPWLVKALLEAQPLDSVETDTLAMVLRLRTSKTERFRYCGADWTFMDADLLSLTSEIDGEKWLTDRMLNLFALSLFGDGANDPVLLLCAELDSVSPT